MFSEASEMTAFDEMSAFLIQGPILEWFPGHKIYLPLKNSGKNMEV